LVAAGAAILIPDAQLDGARLVADLEPILAEPSRLVRMAESARGLAHPDAADRVVALMEQVARV
jgi:UDP-N-acetylglucosamine:LPS N-acetylglucosamine transferase